MRWIGWLLFMLLGLIWLASEIRLPGEGLASPRDTGWRRIDDGWRPASQLIGKAPVRQPALHPWVVGCLELMLAVLALVAFPRSRAPCISARADKAAHGTRRCNKRSLAG